MSHDYANDVEKLRYLHRTKLTIEETFRKINTRKESYKQRTITKKNKGRNVDA